MAATGQVAGGLTAYDREVLTAVNTGAASLSFVGSGFVVLCNVLFKELRKFSFKLVFYLALSDMLCSFFSMVGPEDFSVARTASSLKLITFHMPLWGAVLYNGFTYFQVISMLKNARHMAAGMSDWVYQSDSRAEMKALNRWGYYPLILIGSWGFGAINRIHDFIEPSHKIFWLSVLDVRTAGLTVTWTCSTPCGLNSSVRRAIYERLDLFWPDRLKRWFPNSSKFRNQQLRSELVALKIEDPHHFSTLSH